MNQIYPKDKTQFESLNQDQNENDNEDEDDQEEVKQENAEEGQIFKIKTCTLGCFKIFRQAIKEYFIKLKEKEEALQEQKIELEEEQEKKEKWL